MVGLRRHKKHRAEVKHTLAARGEVYLACRIQAAYSKADEELYMCSEPVPLVERARRGRRSPAPQRNHTRLEMQVQAMFGSASSHLNTPSSGGSQYYPSKANLSRHPTSSVLHAHHIQNSLTKDTYQALKWPYNISKETRQYGQ